MTSNEALERIKLRKYIKCDVCDEMMCKGCFCGNEELINSEELKTIESDLKKLEAIETTGGKKYIMVKGMNKAIELAKNIVDNDHQVVFYETEEGSNTWIIYWCDIVDGNTLCDSTKNKQCEIDHSSETPEESEKTWYYEPSDEAKNR